MSNALPRGQVAIDSGLPQFADRLPDRVASIGIRVHGDTARSVVIDDELRRLPPVEQYSDMHCVTTWSYRSLCWGGYRFRDFFDSVIRPLATPHQGATILVLKGADGARTTLQLEDALSDHVLLADSLNSQPLPLEHGGPLRLVAPAHYGYKSIKYLSDIEFTRSYDRFRPNALRFMDHPRARVAFEERGRWVPGSVLRYLYRPLIRPTIRRFRRGTRRHRQRQDADAR